MAGDEKTEKATPKKRSDARNKEGNVLQSKEINTVVSVLGIFTAMSIFGSFMYVQLLEMVKFWISGIGDNAEFSAEFFNRNAFEVVKYCVIIVGPILIIAMVLGIIPTVVQTKGLFTMKPLRPKFSKLNPFTGIKRLFSIQSVVNIIKGLIEIGIICTVIYTRITSLVPQIKRLPQMEPKQGVAFIASNIFSVVMTIVVVLVFVAAADFIFQWWQFEKNLKMSKQEVKDEYKSVEGDPQIKGKIKQKQREVAQSRMMQEVPTSDVVVRNPTHYAVALKYEYSGALSAPRVVAKGADELAKKIISIAEENGVYITEDRPLARLLYDTVDVGREIPPSLYNAVAVVLSEVYAEKNTPVHMDK